MRRVAATCVLWLGSLAGTPATAQAPAPDPPGPYVVDLRGATGAIPQDASFFPPVPSATTIPSRGIGLDVGAHIYLNRLGAARIGVGASLTRVRGGSSLPVPSTTGSTATSTAPSHPDVDTALTTVAPQVSFNFGSAAGWSYMSAGVGRAYVTTRTSAFIPSGTGAPATPTSARSVNSGALTSINIGGGARWFTKQHLAFSFEVRFHLVSARPGNDVTPATPRMTVVAASVGISLR